MEEVGGNWTLTNEGSRCEEYDSSAWTSSTKVSQTAHVKLGVTHTLDLLETLFVYLANLQVLLLQLLKTSVQRVCDIKLFVFSLVLMIRLDIVHRCRHLFDCGDYAPAFFCDLVLLLRYKLDLVMEGFREGSKQLNKLAGKVAIESCHVPRIRDSLFLGLAHRSHQTARGAAR